MAQCGRIGGWVFHCLAVRYDVLPMLHLGRSVASADAYRGFHQSSQICMCTMCCPGCLRASRCKHTVQRQAHTQSISC